MVWDCSLRIAMQNNQNERCAFDKKKVRQLLLGTDERCRRADRLIEQFADKEQRSKINRLKQLPNDYSYDYMIYQISKKLGQTEQTIRDNYTRAEIKERFLFDIHDQYIDRELMPKPK